MNMLELVYSNRQPSSVPPRAPWAEATDRDLLLAMRAGDESALNELINRKTKPLLHLCQRILGGDLEEARDIVQVTFFKIWENRQRFDAKWAPNTWMYRIASNLAIDHLRSRKTRERSQEPVRQHRPGELLDVVRQRVVAPIERRAGHRRRIRKSGSEPVLEISTAARRCRCPICRACPA